MQGSFDEDDASLLPPACPLRLQGQGAARAHATQSYARLHVVNWQMGNLELLYVEPRGQEKRYWVIDARGEAV